MAAFARRNRTIALATTLAAASVIVLGGQTVAGAGTPKITRFRRGLSGKPVSLVAGPKRTLWFTEGVGSNLRGAVGRITTSGRIREFRRGISGHFYAGGRSIVLGKDGNLWFAESDSTELHGWMGRITPSGKVREFHKGFGAAIGGLALGPDGNVWFTERGLQNGSVGRITPSGAVRVFKQGIHGLPEAITGGPDGNLWFTEDPANPRSGHPAMGRITPGGVVTEFTPPFPIFSSDMVLGPDGNLWYTGARQVYRVSPHPNSTGGLPARGFKIGRPAGFVHALTVGPDKAIWFGPQSESGFTKVGRITTRGRVTRYGAGLGSTRGSFIDGIATGADGNIWFTEFGRTGQPSIDRLRLHYAVP